MQSSTNPTNPFPGLAGVGLLTAVAFVIHELFGTASALVAGVGLGILVANTYLPPSWSAGTKIASRHFLRLGVILLGFRLSLGELRDIGLKGLVIVGMVTTTAFFSTWWIGRRAGLSDNLSILVATGFSICGASAVAAMDGIVEAEEEEVAYAVGMVTLFGSLAIVLLPLLAIPLSLEGAAFGSWVGASVHDVAQVVATAASGGEEASSAAIVVKLTRVALLAPMVAAMAVRRRRLAQPIGAKRPPIIPAFVMFFLVAVVLRSTGWLTDTALDGIKLLSTVLLTVAMVGLGLGVRIRRLKTLGFKPVLVGLLSWTIIATLAYAGVVATS